VGLEEDLARSRPIFTTVCVYDRAGLGESEPGPRPRTPYNMVEDLHRLLKRSHVPPPYVPVGFSFGGLIAQVFARRHPELVSVMVLIDSTSPDQFSRIAPFLTPSAAAKAQELFRKPNPEHVQLRRAERPPRANAPFPHIPLIVLSSPPSAEFRESVRGHEKEARTAINKLDEELAALSPHGRLIRVKRTSHFIPLDRPDVVIRNIKTVVNAPRYHLQATSLTLNRRSETLSREH
jgi:pimeloyl-ACP methyl ester carboxylesterase